MGLGDKSGLSFDCAGQTPLKDEVWRHGKKDEHKAVTSVNKGGLTGVRGKAERHAEFPNNFRL